MKHVKYHGAYPMGYMKAFSVICSESTRKKMEEFLTVNKEFSEKISKVKIDDRSLVIYEFDSPFEHINMLELSSDSAAKIDELCKDLKDEDSIKEELLKYISENIQELEGNSQIIQKMIDKLFNILVYHYFTRRDNLKPPYSKEYLGERNIYILYPLSVDTLRGLNYLLNRINFGKKDNILKEQLSVQ